MRCDVDVPIFFHIDELKPLKYGYKELYVSKYFYELKKLLLKFNPFRMRNDYNFLRFNDHR